MCECKPLFQERNQLAGSNIQDLLADLKACSKNQNLDRGKALHAELVQCGHDSSIYVANSLINMYAKCGSLIDAHHMFDITKNPTVVSWNVLILGYAEDGQGLAALNLFRRMRNEGPTPSSVTFLAALKACTSIATKSGALGRNECLQNGKEIHHLAVGNLSIHVQNTLIDMYAKCGSIEDSCQVFDSMRHPNLVSWNAMILGFADNGQGLNALDLFSRMPSAGHVPNAVTILACLKACISLAMNGGAKGRVECMHRGEKVHFLAVKIGHYSDVSVRNALIDMYSKCFSMKSAREVFDSMKQQDVVSWTALILGYAENGHGTISLGLFRVMKRRGIAPDSITFVAALKACTTKMDLCRAIHVLAVENGHDSDMYVQSALIDAYSKCGSMVDSCRVFNSMPHPQVVSWNVLILGYVHNGQGLSALEIFTRMKSGGCAPNSATFKAVLKACALVGGLEMGRSIHSQIGAYNVDLVNCLVSFYAKCGSLVEAQSVFDLQVETRDVITYNALLTGYISHGDQDSVFGLFEAMEDAGMRPNIVTFLSILTYCSHAGLVDKGKECLHVMYSKYGLIPAVEHYTCLVDLLGRANMLDEAMACIESMPCSPNYVTWTSVLGACWKWKNLEIGRLAFHSLTSFSDKDPAAHVLLGHLYGRGEKLNYEPM